MTEGGVRGWQGDFARAWAEGWREGAWVLDAARYPRRGAGMTDLFRAGMTDLVHVGMTEKGGWSG